jgi:hypothetical protein
MSWLALLAQLTERDAHNGLLLWLFSPRTTHRRMRKKEEIHAEARRRASPASLCWFSKGIFGALGAPGTKLERRKADQNLRGSAALRESSFFFECRDRPQLRETIGADVIRGMR